MNEAKFRSGLKKKIKSIYKNALILFLDPRDIQGIPDLLILEKNKWVALETKKTASSSLRPNQQYYIDKMEDMSMARVIYPENEMEVINDIVEFIGGEDKQMSNFNFNKNRNEGHAVLSPSKNTWLNLQDEQLLKYLTKMKAAEQGTKIHKIAADLIENQIKLPNTKETLHMYVNDAIKYGLRPEVALMYSKNAYGTADAIGFDGKILRINDLKTGEKRCDHLQLKIYAAYFCLEYNIPPETIQIITSIFQNKQKVEMEAVSDEIRHIMNQVIYADKICQGILTKGV